MARICTSYAIVLAAILWLIIFIVLVHAQPVSAPEYFNATPVTVSATGTTAATTATIPAIATSTAHLCGFSIRANATAASTGDATVTGLISGTLHFTQWTAPLASGIGIVEPDLGMCIRASAPNTAISVISAAPGSGGTVSVSAWGFYGP
jgi:hypothetical protein